MRIFRENNLAQYSNSKILKGVIRLMLLIYIDILRVWGVNGEIKFKIQTVIEIEKGTKLF